jgi:4-hydroxy-3-polyprenylbenzoate decarboxylase
MTPTYNHADHPRQLVVAITGASGALYAVRLLQVLLEARSTVHLVVSSAARQVFDQELDVALPNVSAPANAWPELIQQITSNSPNSPWHFRPLHTTPATTPATGTLIQYGTADYSSPVASGSSLTDGMIICPCSMGTLSSIAAGNSSNLIQRAADVHLKERRPLILVPRETPLGMIQLENMVRVSRAGATVMPAMPGLYQKPTSIGDLIDFIVARICDHLRIPHALTHRWGSPHTPAP